MDCKVTLSPRSIQDLREIVRYISFDDPVRAESFGRELIQKTRLLGSFPEMGRIVLGVMIQAVSITPASARPN